MRSEQDILQAFELGLEPEWPDRSAIPCRILGYGEISTVLEIEGIPGFAAKRMPLFNSIAAAETYIGHYDTYCQRLRSAGLQIPEGRTVTVSGKVGNTVLYLLQRKLSPERFCHKLIHQQEEPQNKAIIIRLITELEKVWSYNASRSSEIKLAIDGQLSNWVLLENGDIFYVDTSTPLMHENGDEVLDPELFLQSAPSFLRWLIRWQFLDDVMSRYYDSRLVYTDLIANLFKEQKADLVDDWLKAINHATSGRMDALDRRQIEAYYREDKLIWSLFLALRRLDRFIKQSLLGKRYEFILPGKIKR